MSYLRPVIVPTDAVDELTPEGDYEEEEEDLTSPISGTVQPSPPVQTHTHTHCILDYIITNNKQTSVFLVNN